MKFARHWCLPHFYYFFTIDVRLKTCRAFQHPPPTHTHTGSGSILHQFILILFLEVDFVAFFCVLNVSAVVFFWSYAVPPISSPPFDDWSVIPIKPLFLPPEPEDIDFFSFFKKETKQYIDIAL